MHSCMDKHFAKSERNIPAHLTMLWKPFKGDWKTKVLFGKRKKTAVPSDNGPTPRTQAYYVSWMPCFMRNFYNRAVTLPMSVKQIAK